MPSQTFIVRTHSRTIHSWPFTFTCKKCGQKTTRDVWNSRPKYCLTCSPKKKPHNDQHQGKRMFRPHPKPDS